MLRSLVTAGKRAIPVIFPVEICIFHNNRHVKNCHIGLVADTVVVCYLGMNLTEITHHLTVVDDVCLTARMQEGLACLRDHN